LLADSENRTAMFLIDEAFPTEQICTCVREQSKLLVHVAFLPRGQAGFSLLQGESSNLPLWFSDEVGCSGNFTDL